MRRRKTARQIKPKLLIAYIIMLSKFKSDGMVVVPELTTKEGKNVYVKMSLCYDSVRVTFFPKVIMHGNDIHWNGASYWADVKIDDIRFIEDCINKWIREHEVYLGDVRLKDYTFEDHDKRIHDCSKNLYDRETAEWLVGDTLDEYDEMLEEEQRKYDEFVMNCAIIDSINYLDCVVA